MNTKPGQWFSCRLAIAAALAGMTLPILPATVAAQETVLDEIIVTARKREESLHRSCRRFTAGDKIGASYGYELGHE